MHDKTSAARTRRHAPHTHADGHKEIIIIIISTASVPQCGRLQQRTIGCQPFCPKVNKAAGSTSTKNRWFPSWPQSRAPKKYRAIRLLQCVKRAPLMPRNQPERNQRGTPHGNDPRSKEQRILYPHVGMQARKCHVCSFTAYEGCGAPCHQHCLDGMPASLPCDRWTPLVRCRARSSY